MPPLALLALLGIPVAAFLVTRGKAPDGAANSRREEMGESTSTSGSYGGAKGLLGALGWPYKFGGQAATPTWARGPEGVDCSEFAALALHRMGLWPASWGSFRQIPARELANKWCDAVAWGKQRPGDLAYYPGHVMVVLSYPRSDGDSEVIGASGGDSDTQGYDPMGPGYSANARVKKFASARYRSDFVTFMRPKGVS